MKKISLKGLIGLIGFCCLLTNFKSLEARYISRETACLYHLATDIDRFSNRVTLEDGSQWKIANYDIFSLFSWNPYDNLIISPQYYPNNFTYYITNQQTGSYVSANLVGSPVRGGPYTVMITGLDQNTEFKKAIYLNNDTFWLVSQNDWPLIENWYVDDLMIMGKNNEWFSFNTHILINIHTNTFVRVRKL